MLKKFEKVAVGAAIESGDFIRRSVGKVRSVSYKGRDNIVTDVDKASENIIISAIRKNFPSHSILSEEAGRSRGVAEYRWIIDPLDGTTNFAHAFPFFSVSIALEVSGRVALGVVYDPMRKELFFAAQGCGSFLNGKPVKCSQVRTLADSFLATGFSYGRKKKDANVPVFRRFLLNSMAVRRAGSAALDLTYVACGRFDGFWELDLKPWDTAAGVLIVKEAGGVVTRFDGSPYNVDDKSVLATNGLLHKPMISILSKTGSR